MCVCVTLDMHVTQEKYIMNKDAKVKVVLKEYSYKVTSEQINNEDLLTGYNMQIKASTYELIEPKYMTVTLNITGKSQCF